MKTHRINPIRTLRLWWKILLPIVFWGSIQGQQLPQYTQYMYNTASLNPAYIGTFTRMEGSFLYRSQWAGIEGAPETLSLGLSGLISSRIGLGVNALSEKIGPAHQADFSAAFSYQLHLSTNVDLSLGINAGMGMLNIDWSKGNFYDPNDILLQNEDSNWKPILGAGALLHGDNWYAGLSFPDLVRTSFNDDEDFPLHRELYMYAMGGYILELSRNILFKPTFLVKMASNTRLSTDVSANFLLHQKVVVGGAYRFTDAMSFLVGFYPKQPFFIGYSYDHTTSGLNGYNDGSHEIILRVMWDNIHKKARSPRYF